MLGATLISLIGFCLLESFASEVHHNLNEGEEFNIQSLNYPEPATPYLQQSWTVQSPSGTYMQLLCRDIRLRQLYPPSCDGDEFIIIYDGNEKKQICGVMYDYTQVTKSNVLKFELRTGKWAGGGVDCHIKIYETTTTPIPASSPTNAPEPERVPSKEKVVEEEEEVYIPPGKSLEVMSQNWPNRPPANYQKTWTVTTDTKAKLSIYCHDIRSYQDNPPGCDDYAVIFEDGEERYELCGSRSGFTHSAKSTTIKVILKTGEVGGTFMKCQIHANEVDEYGEKTHYLDIQSDEIDSSEHGGPLGAKNTSCPCGWTNKASKRIVNGVETGINEYPWVIALIHGERKFHFCGGSIITPFHVLTAAHCTVPYSSEPLAVIVGEHNLETDDETDASKEIAVRKVIDHPNYKNTVLGYDISILLLAEKIEYSKLVGPICLPPKKLDIERQYVKIIGWGNLKWRGPSPDALQKVNLRVVPFAACHKVYSSIPSEKRIQICTYSTNKAACQGDSGGPVVWLDPETNRYVLAGLVSFGTTCADKNPQVHTDVAEFYDWIQENIKATAPHETCSKF